MGYVKIEDNLSGVYDIPNELLSNISKCVEYLNYYDKVYSQKIIKIILKLFVDERLETFSFDTLFKIRE